MFTKPARPQPRRRPSTAASTAAADRFWTCAPNDLTNPVCWSDPGPVHASDKLLIRPNGPTPVVVTFPGGAAINNRIGVQSGTIHGAANSAEPRLNSRSAELVMTSYLDTGRDFRATVAQKGGIVRTPSLVVNAAGVMSVSGVSQLIATSLVNAASVSITGQTAQVQTATASNSGTLTLVNAAFTASNGLTNTARIDATNSTITGLQWNAGTLIARGPDVTLIHSQPLSNAVGLAITDNTQVNNPEGMRNEVGATVSLQGVDTGNGPQAYLSIGNTGAVLTKLGGITGAGFVVMPVDNQGSVVAQSSANVANDAILTFSNSFSRVAGSSMVAIGTLNFAGPTSVHNGAMISGPGNTTIRHKVDVGTAGAAGRLAVEGKVVRGNFYNADILGTDAGSGYDQLAVGGPLTLAPGSILKLNSGSLIAQAGQRFSWALTIAGTLGLAVRRRRYRMTLAQSCSRRHRRLRLLRANPGLETGSQALIWIVQRDALS